MKIFFIIATALSSLIGTFLIVGGLLGLIFCGDSPNNSDVYSCTHFTIMVGILGIIIAASPSFGWKLYTSESKTQKIIGITGMSIIFSLSLLIIYYSLQR